MIPRMIEKLFPHLPDMDYRAFGHFEGDDRPVNTGQAKGVLRRMVEGETVLAAAALDNALNNTSLMLMFEVGDQYLLFPGDSQWGT